MNRRVALPILLFAFAAAAYCATQTLNKDALIFFQAGLRQSAGQTPYVDYSLPQGPGAAWVAAPFFWLFPPMVAWAVLSGLLNAGMAALVALVVWKTTGLAVASYLGALASALLFLPPFGSFYNDHLAYFLGALGFALFYYSRRAAWAALCLALAFHCKQTLGLATILAFALALKREALRPLALTAFFIFAGVVVICAGGGGSAYWWDVVYLPLTFAQNSPDKNPGRLVSFVLFPWGIWPSDLISDLPRHWGRWALFPFQILFWSWLFRWPERGKGRTTLIFFSLSTLWGGALLGRAASHLFMGTGVVLGLARKQFPSGPVTALLLFCLLPFGHSLLVRHREGISDDAKKMASALGPYRNVGGYALGEKALLAVSLAGIAPRQLNVYDDMAVSVPATYLGLFRWQTRFRERLERDRPEWILRDAGWTVTPGIGRPLRQYFAENFVEVGAFGSLRLLKRRPPALPQSAENRHR